jgi:DHA1 family tetracycline resistance protein-like MFS transporter
MPLFKPTHQQNAERHVDKKALGFGLMSAFLCAMGFSIIGPVVPFLVQPYVNSPTEQALIVTLLMSVYAFCVFLASPVLGTLSDRFGRRPLLLICLLGASVGYLVFGIGGALWVLFLGRIIEGITGGAIGTIFAYFADIIPKAQRTRYFGWLSAFVGVGAVLGPTLGGVLANFGYAAPMFFGATITFVNAAFGFFFMAESLTKTNRLKEIIPARLNPFIQLISILSAQNLGRLLVSAFLLWLPNGSFQAIFSQMAVDAFSWEPVAIGLLFSIMGVQDIVSQALIMPQLLKKLGDRQIARLGMVAEIIGYGFIATSVLLTYYPLLVAGVFIFAFGDSIFGPAFNGMLSKSVDNSEQGRVQGGSQSIQAIARMIGPLVGGVIYVQLGHAAPAFMGVLLILAAIVVSFKKEVSMGEKPRGHIT